ncbi:MAG: hypothetical protein CMB79_11170, partial [Filomicrobium sp.]|nr:hypothetical protein [Filomicrobium sp.]
RQRSIEPFVALTREGNKQKDKVGQFEGAVDTGDFNAPAFRNDRTVSCATLRANASRSISVDLTFCADAIVDHEARAAMERSVRNIIKNALTAMNVQLAA